MRTAFPLSRTRPAASLAMASAIVLATSAALPAASSEGDEKLTAEQLAARIDEMFAKTWASENVVPAPRATDAEFLRRATLDLTGKIPSAFEARQFLADSRPDKRRRLVETLLDRATFATHFANLWRDLLLPGANNNLQTRALVPEFEDWLRLRLVAGTSYDDLVEEILTFKMEQGQQAQPPNRRGIAQPTPRAFYIANEQKPENLAASTASAFLALQVQCAQCHDHFFADWKRGQFWSFASFFQPKNDKDSILKGISIPGTKTMAPAVFLDGSKPKWNADEGGREIVARWIASRDNPYFAKATANRLWYICFGRGLVEPVNDLDPTHEPAHPEAFELISRQLALHDFDLKYLLRAITATRLYSLSSETTNASQEEWRHFARMPLRSMTAEQLFDSVVQATGYRPAPQRNRRNVLPDLTNARAKFLSKFADSGPAPTDYEASILQALTLMNGRIIADSTSLTEGETFRAVTEAPFLDLGERIDTLYLATLTRFPESDEKQQMLEYVEHGKDQKKALADIFWALLNSPEFVLVH